MFRSAEVGGIQRTKTVQGRVGLDSHPSNNVPLGEFARVAGLFERQVPGYQVGGIL